MSPPCYEKIRRQAYVRKKKYGVLRVSVPVNDRDNVYFRKLIMTVVVIFGSIYFSTVRLLQKNLKTIVISLSYDVKCI